MSKRLFLSYSLVPLLVLPFLISASLPTSDLAKETLKSTRGDQFTIEYPREWKTEKQSAPDMPIVTLRLINPAESSLLLVSLIPSKTNAVVDKVEDLERILINGTKPMVKDSVEKAVRTQTFRSDYCFGVYTLLTDSRYVEQNPPRGEYRYSATFILAYPGYVVTATFLTQDDITESVDLAVLLLKTLRKI